jgi:hypothetical protein
VPEETAGIGKQWLAALGPDMRAQMMHILALDHDPSEEQIAELPDLIKKSWSFDALGIAEDDRPAIRAAVGELAVKLGTGAKSRKRRKRVSGRAR